MKKILTLLLFILSMNAYSQIQNDIYHFKYKLHNTTSNTYGNPVEFATNHFASDFGKRKFTGAGSRWHRGVDFNRDAPTTQWDLFLSINQGTIRKLKGGSGYKYIFTEGTETNELHNFGYGHIFDHFAPNPSCQKGGLVLSKMDEPNSAYYAIIDFSNPNDVRAFGPETGIVTYDGISYEVTTQIEQDEVLGCIGKSKNIYEDYNYMHVHVYMFGDINVAIGGSNGSHNNYFNDHDPMQFISHVNTIFDISIETDGNINSEKIVTSSGEHAISLKIRSTMENAILDVSRFTNVLMDIDNIDVYIKKGYLPNESNSQWGNSTSKYQLILGHWIESHLSHGARLESELYPVIAAYGHLANPPTNTEINVAGDTYGNFLSPGIDPFAYYSGGSLPYDDYYFSDFYTRMDKDYELGNTLEFAKASEGAKYPDGKYNIYSKITTVRDDVYTSIDDGVEPVEIIIDNFKPFIKKVEIYANSPSNLQYSREWIWNTNSEQYELDPIPLGVNITPNDNIIVKVETSESMEKVDLVLNGYSNTNIYPENDERTVWRFDISSLFVNDNTNQFYIDGKDLANNAIQNYSPSNVITVPIRQNENSWIPNYSEAPEESFYFEAALSDVDFSYYQTGEEDRKYQFNDQSTYTNITNYLWDVPVASGYWIFTSGTNENSENPLIEFYSNGEYDVKLTVTHDGENSYLTKIIEVNELQPPTADFFYYLEGNKGKTIQFMDNSEGAVTGRIWSIEPSTYTFVNGTDANSQNPKVTFDNTVNYTVNLEVLNNAGNDDTEEIFNPSTIPHINFWDYPNNSFDDFERAFEVEVFDLAPPYTFTIKYGDGNIETEYTGDENDYTFIHTYSAVGSYKVIVEVTGTSNNGGPDFAQYVEWIDINSGTLDIQIAFDPVVMDNNYPNPTNLPPYLDQLVDIRPSSITGDNMSIWWTIIHEGDIVFSKHVFDDDLNELSLLNYQFEEPGNYQIQMTISGGVSYGWAYDTYQFELNEADCYIGTWLYGADESAPNVLLGFEGQTEAQGTPGVSEASSIPTNVRWTLYNPNGVAVVTETSENTAFNIYNSFDEFTMEGEYTLTLESWNNTHGYEENNFLNPDYARALPFYSYAEKTIIIDSDIGTLNIIEPENTWFVDFSAAEQDYSIVFSILGNISTEFYWELIIDNGDEFLSVTGANNGVVNGNQVDNVVVHLLHSSVADQQYGHISLHAYNYENGIIGQEVVNGDFGLHITQCGTAGPKYQTVDAGDYAYNGMRFGSAVAIDGNYAIVGAEGDDDVRGSAFVLKKNSIGEWSIIQELICTSYVGNGFGKAVDIYSDYIVVGWDEHINIYKRVNGFYHLIKSIYSEGNPSYGKSVAIWGDYIAVGAPTNSNNGNNAGNVNIYYRNQGGTDEWGWVKLIADCSQTDFFGTHVDLESGMLAVGIPMHSTYPGRVRLYNRNHTNSDDWGLSNTFEPSHPSDVNCRFGQSFALTKNRLSVGYLYDTLIHNDIVFVMHGEDNYAKLTTGEWVMADHKDIGEVFCHHEVAATRQLSGFYNGINSSIITSDSMHVHGIPIYPITDYNSMDQYGQFIYRYSKTFFYYHSTSYRYYENSYNQPSWYPPQENDLFGYSMAASFSHLAVGIPGRNENEGVLFFDRRSYYQTPCEAGTDLNLINFEKPAGLYPDVIAENITLGGQGYEAKILSGAEITYEANNITLNTGFSAEAGSKFSAISSDCTAPEDPGKGEQGQPTDNIRDLNMLLVLKVLSREYDYSWGYLDVYGDSTEYQLVNEKDEIQKVIKNPTVDNYEINLADFSYQELHLVLKVGDKSFRFLFDKKQEDIEQNSKLFIKNK